MGVAGLNQNSYSQYANAGRVRRFYVSAQFRRKGIGKRLLKEVTHYAENYYDSLVLYTDTDEAKLFYFMNETVLNAYTISIKSLVNIN
ncbi:GNAT family N-acetyltransferase [Priestia megaterium]|uniref:GNAT family N-acetyltransferase n=1 Tax=Priestia megaterium TaxID=1404 RepID=UPI002E1D9131|nr:GNAT family N-acetyltransferase [Priestia megaterium]MED4290063.1 GNAT family N-acetyltransferase [Priestia megaterium]MED4293335.1 GNAT family N-acetyltransferase [Priestia megaterium]